MLFPSPDAELTRGRVDFDITKFRNLVRQKGLDLKWHQSAICPCQPKSVDYGLDLSGIDDIDIGTGFTPACPVCSGKGIILHSAQTIKAIITNADTEYLNARYGGYRNGTINISLLPEHLPGYGDVFEIVNAVMLYREAVRVDDTNTTELRYPIANRQLVLETGEGTYNVLYAHKTDPVTGLAVLGGTLSAADYNVNNGIIEWINKPAEGTRVSFSYFTSPRYIVRSYPNSIRDTRTKIKAPTDTFQPQLVRVQAVLEFLDTGGT